MLVLFYGFHCFREGPTSAEGFKFIGCTKEDGFAGR
jgi:hypothetical protein